MSLASLLSATAPRGGRTAGQSPARTQAVLAILDQFFDPAFSFAESSGIGPLAFVETATYGSSLKNQLLVGDANGDLYLFQLKKKAKQRKPGFQGCDADQRADDFAPVQVMSLRWVVA